MFFAFFISESNWFCRWFSLSLSIEAFTAFLANLIPFLMLSEFSSILLNISDDHQDRYKSMEHYASIKEKILNGKEILYSIISLDDRFCTEIYNRNTRLNKKIIPISSLSIISNGVSLIDGKI